MLERLGEQLVRTDLDVEAQLDVICSTLPDVWSVTPDPQLRTAAEEAARLIDAILDRAAGRADACPTWLVDDAVRRAERRGSGADVEHAVLVHGDAHQWNTLRDPLRPGTFRFIDPDGLRAEPEYDLAVLMREYTSDLLGPGLAAAGRDRARWLARRTGTDAQRIWDWAVVLLVDNGLAYVQTGDRATAHANLSVAAVWARD